MKTKYVLLAVLMSASAMVFANEPGSFKVAVVNQKESTIFKVIYEGEKKGNVKLNILNNEGTIVFEETIKNVESFVRPLNFKEMAHGQYTIEIVDHSGKKIQKVDYATTAPLISNVRVAKTGENGKYLFTIANQASGKVDLKIYDGASELVHNQTLTINGDYGVIYDLQRISGEPTFTITDNSGAVQVIK